MSDTKDEIMSALVWPLDSASNILQGVRMLGKKDTMGPGAVVSLVIGGGPLAMALLAGYLLRGQAPTMRWLAAYGAGAASAASHVPAQQVIDLLLKLKSK